MKNKHYAIFGVVFLFLSLIGAVYLSLQNADSRNQAANGRVVNCEDLGSPSARQRCAAENGGDMKAPITSSNEIVPCGQGAIQCGGCGGFCISGATKTCDQAILEKCGEFPTRGANITGIGADCKAASYGAKCTCGSTTVCFDSKNYDTAVKDNGCNRTDGMGLCDVWQNFGAPKTPQELAGNVSTATSTTYYCPGRFLGQDGSSCTTAPKAGFNINCYCGTIQIDTPGVGFHSESMKCGCDEKDTPPNTPSTGTPIPTRTPTPTFIIVTDTPSPTPTGTRAPTETPTNTPIPTNTPVPTSTPVPTNLGCGYTPCDNSGKQCSSGLVCITANNSGQYCSLPQFTGTCATNPGYTGCCTAPGVTDTQGPSPTRIILPVSGFEFPIQALTLIGGITTLLGFLILL
ncbi:MAG: hypothetical protein WC069_03750 [Candidatus Shapirobacteria bacterium]